jgi:hypothetical protein
MPPDISDRTDGRPGLFGRQRYSIVAQFSRPFANDQQSVEYGKESLFILCE